MLGFSIMQTKNFQTSKQVLEKEEDIRNQIANIHWIIHKISEFQKNIYLCFIDYVKAFDCVECEKLWKVLERWEYQTILPVS